VTCIIISKGNLTQYSLKGEVVIVTGAGRGIGFEAAIALVWLGANVVIAEIDEKNGSRQRPSIKKSTLKKFYLSKQILATKKTSTNYMKPYRKNSAKST
jgi:NADP-dependent 3-hydroxy acid dehydrogenase YdfG